MLWNLQSRIYLARHGQVKGYETMPIYGHTDVPTTEIGMLQARHLAERLRFADIGAIYSSDPGPCILHGLSDRPLP